METATYLNDKYLFRLMVYFVLWEGEARQLIKHPVEAKEETTCSQRR